MKTFLVMILLVAVAQSSEPLQKPSPQPCAATTLVGTWQLAKSGGEATAGSGSTVLKHVTPTHFFVLSADASGSASYGHGGPYTLSGDTYTESITHGFGAPFTQLRGTSVALRCSIEGDQWHTVGQIGDQTFDEYWNRVPPATTK